MLRWKRYLRDSLGTGKLRPVYELHLDGVQLLGAVSQDTRGNWMVLAQHDQWGNLAYAGTHTTAKEARRAVYRRMLARRAQDARVRLGEEPLVVYEKL